VSCLLANCAAGDSSDFRGEPFACGRAPSPPSPPSPPTSFPPSPQNRPPSSPTGVKSGSPKNGLRRGPAEVAAAAAAAVLLSLGWLAA
jgi:hypothetical protein